MAQTVTSSCTSTYQTCSGDAIKLEPNSTTGLTNFKWYYGSVAPANEITALTAASFNVDAGQSTFPSVIVVTVPVSGSTTSGTYILTAEYTAAPGGCPTEINNVTLEFLPAPDLSASGQTVCSGAGTSVNLASLVTDGNNTTGSLAYYPTQSDAENETNALASGTVTPTSTTTYYVRKNTTATGASGTCFDIVSVTVTVAPLPTVSLAVAETSCTDDDAKILSGDAVTLTASGSGGTGALAYTWDNSLPNGAANNVNPTSTTTYNVTATDQNNCTATASATVTIVTAPSVTLAETDNSCTADDGKVLSGEAATLTASGSGGTAPLSYDWDNSLPTNASNNVSPTSTTMYNVTVSDANGCTDHASITVTVVTPPTADAGSDVAICAGASTTLSGSGGGTYAWSPAGSLNDATLAGPTATPSSTTTYTLVVTDANGCTDDDAVAVTVNPLPSFSLSLVDVCPGENPIVSVMGLANADPNTSDMKVNSGAYAAYNSYTGGQITTNEGLVPNSTNNVTIRNAEGCTTTESIAAPGVVANVCVPIRITKVN